MTVLREHLLLGSEQFGTVETGCGRKPEKINDSYCLGASSAYFEVEYRRLRKIWMMRMCVVCERKWRRICRERNEKWTTNARDKAAP